MMSSLAALFFIGLAFYSEGQPDFLSRCYKFFSSDPVEYRLSEKTNWSNPYAQRLFSLVYQQLPLLGEKALSLEDTKKYILYFEKLIAHLESSSESNTMNRLDLMNRLDFMSSHLFESMKAFPLIVSFVNSGKADEYESLDINTVIKLILSTFSQHIMTYLTHPERESLDWARINQILKSISDFKDKMDVFSLYKIQRAVRQKYSVKEYLNCQ